MQPSPSPSSSSSSWLPRFTAALREGVGVGRWEFRRGEGRPSGAAVPTSHHQLASSPVFFGREASHELGPLYQVWHLGRPVLVIARHGLAAEFNRNQLEHERTKHMSLGCVMERLIGEAVGAAVGREWGRHRQHFRAEFGKPAAAVRLPLVEDHVRQWVRSLAAASAGLGSFSVADLALNRLTVRILSDICYGAAFSRAHMAELEEIIQLHARLMAALGTPITCIPGYRLLPTALNRDLARFEARWRSFNRRAWSEIAAGEACVVGHLRQLEAKGALRLSEREIHHNLEEILLLNIDVTYCAMGGLMVDLARRPDWQARLREEVVRHVGGGLSRAAPLRAADLDRLQDMDNFIAESARLWPALALTLPVELPCNMDIGGARVPRGTMAVLDTFSINHDPAAFPDPDAFDPDRFRGHPELHGKMFRFGMGARKCMGQHYATSVIKTLLVHLLSEQQVCVADAADAEPLPRVARNSRGEELRYFARCREVRPAGMAYFSPYLVFPQLRSTPLRRSPVNVPVLDAVNVVAGHYWRTVGGGCASACQDAAATSQKEPSAPSSWTSATAAVRAGA